MNQSPAVSVVIATFNRAGYLPATIDSVLHQLFQDFELIVVDDGSTDNTRAVLESYGSRLKYLYQSNGGASSARVRGFVPDTTRHQTLQSGLFRSTDAGATWTRMNSENIAA